MSGSAFGCGVVGIILVVRQMRVECMLNLWAIFVAFTLEGWNLNPPTAHVDRSWNLAGLTTVYRHWLLLVFEAGLPWVWIS